MVDSSRFVGIHSNSTLLRMPAALHNASSIAPFMTSSLSTPGIRLAILKYLLEHPIVKGLRNITVIERNSPIITTT